jgi:hypothetical protein
MGNLLENNCQLEKVEEVCDECKDEFVLDEASGFMLKAVKTLL